MYLIEVDGARTQCLEALHGSVLGSLAALHRYPHPVAAPFQLVVVLHACHMLRIRTCAGCRWAYLEGVVELDRYVHFLIGFQRDVDGALDLPRRLQTRRVSNISGDARVCQH